MTVLKILLLATLLGSATAQAESDPGQPVAQDKLLHFSLSALATSGSIKFGQALNSRHRITYWNRVLSSMMVLGAGYAKEKYDQDQTAQPFDRADFEADAWGVLTGNLLQWEF